MDEDVLLKEEGHVMLSDFVLSLRCAAVNLSIASYKGHRRRRQPLPLPLPPPPPAKLSGVPLAFVGPKKLQKLGRSGVEKQSDGGWPRRRDGLVVSSGRDLPLRVSSAWEDLIQGPGEPCQSCSS
ncbi:unnamed protein product [Spirodela intermedia]|uniref:Uncharacterized protein n=1 Tax=Spirodela intermedia TaxID=51605 RepID=A0A7I8KDL7_SPIIN|nr:unnamed protein product [Spirodela intermedia]